MTGSTRSTDAGIATTIIDVMTTITIVTTAFGTVAVGGTAATTMNTVTRAGVAGIATATTRSTITRESTATMATTGVARAVARPQASTPRPSVPGAEILPSSA